MVSLTPSLDFDRTSVRPYSWAIALTAMILAVGCGGAAILPISGAAVAPGRLVSEGYDVRIQAGEPGIIDHLNVHEGQKVAAGEVLFQLQNTQQAAAFQTLHDERLTLEAQRDRLLIQAGLKARLGGSDLQLSETSTQQEGQSRRDQRALLDAQALAKARRLKALANQSAAEAAASAALRQEANLQQSQVDISQTELPNLKKLFDEGYAPLSAVNAAELKARALAGERQQILTQAAQADDKVTGYHLEGLQLEAQQRADALAELNQVEARLAETAPREASAADQLHNLQIRAPHAGMVHELQLHSAGEVLGAGEVAMLIVPIDEPLAVDLRIDPRQVDEVAAGQSVRIRVGSGDPSSTPELNGRVARVSSDAEKDPHGEKPFYLVHVVISKTEWNRLAGTRILPGLPVQAFISERPRTLMSYIVSPLTDRFHRALRER